ncbi:aldehyde dehydrogenase [Pseudonocardia endophytica]|uniref:Acyl-CoA reductase-like NAD-dependent aldehyde dehydrogenase n=1 Tax=Pseudonocardia endophytica TaxID=401976 RepID=A0A4R1HZ23_PSEEN|nr:aldehyde dehydrogenase [Pseudonocardia endophytica]TCK26811.1 acyl-CoA reductase-like NAD-dependent aldehyde dehydrogenase [Pseudonocardia endophytica]
MSITDDTRAPLRSLDRFFIGGQWVSPSTDATIDVIEAATEQLYYRIAEAREADMDRAVGAAAEAFHEGPWPRMSHQERAGYLRAIGEKLRERAADAADIWPRESGILHASARAGTAQTGKIYEYYAGLADTFDWTEPATPQAGAWAEIVKEPVGVVGAIIPWNGPPGLIAWKVAPALIAGCTVVLKNSPEAPGAGYLIAEICEQIGLPPGVVNVVTADREVSELLVRDPRVDKIAFTGSTAAGKRIASLCGERIARCTLELGGKSAAVVLDDADLAEAASVLSAAECNISGQVCSSLTRIVVTRNRHDELAEALAATFSQVRVGDPFDEATQMGPLAMQRQRDRVEGYIATGVREGARLLTGGGRPKGLDKGWFVEPTVFAGVDNASTIGREEIFGPVLSVIPADDEEHAIRIANDTNYGLNASVFTPDVERARAVARRLRSGTVGHNAHRTDFWVGFGGFKQSGLGREGGVEGLRMYLENKSVILNEVPPGS